MRSERRRGAAGRLLRKSFSSWACSAAAVPSARRQQQTIGNTLSKCTTSQRREASGAGPWLRKAGQKRWLRPLQAVRAAQAVECSEAQRSCRCQRASRLTARRRGFSPHELPAPVPPWRPRPTLKIASGSSAPRCSRSHSTVRRRATVGLPMPLCICPRLRGAAFHRYAPTAAEATRTLFRLHLSVIACALTQALSSRSANTSSSLMG